MGDFKEDKKNGKGTYYYANGDKYTGDWVDDHESGQGIFTGADGDRYEITYSQMSYHHSVMISTV